MRQISVWRRVIVGILLAVSFSYAHAVEVTARIKGTVTDPSGAVVPKATVTVTNTQTGVVTTTTSNSAGDYIFPALPIGTYSINVAAPGFKGFTATGITLNIDQEFVEAVKLSLGSSSDTVSVEADGVQVNTTDMQLSNIVDSHQITELPLIGRAFTQLELILPGVQAAADRFTTAYSVNGSQAQQSGYVINGADSNDLPLNTIAIQPNIDALAQFNLITGPLNAEYDRNGGAIVNTAIKQGTNHFHGDAFEFYRDTFLNTRNYFQKSVIGTTASGAPIIQPTSPFHQNIFGGTIGGPVLKDKLFFFFAYQGIRQRVPQTGGNVQVFSANELAGNFTGTTFSTNVIPATINIPGCSSGTQTFASCFSSANRNGQLPVGAFNPVSANLIKTYVPPANSGTNTFTFNPTVTTTTDQYIARADYNVSPKDQLYGVFIYQKSFSPETLPFTGATIPGFGDMSTTWIHQYSAGYTRQINNTTVNDLEVHYTRFNFDSVEPQHIVAPSSLGFSIFPQNTKAQSVPTVSLAGTNSSQPNFTLGFSTNGPQPRIDEVYQINDSIAKSIGHHNLKFGYDGRKYKVNNPFYAQNSGNFAFNSTAGAGNAASSGDVALDFLLGIPNTYGQGSGAPINAYAYLNYLFAQDTWKATSSLTISYGLGYQIDTPLHNTQFNGIGVTCYLPGVQSKVFPSAPKNLAYPGDPGCNNASGATTRYSDFGPRIGFAWAPDLGLLSGGASRKLSFRAGYGIYYNRTEEETSLQNLQDPPFGISSGGAVDYGANNPGFANPFQDVNVTGASGIYPNKFPFVPPSAGSSPDFSIFTPFSLSQYAPGFRSPYSENFQLTIEREFPGQFVARASYVGALGRHNQNNIEGNPETQAGHDACLADATCRTTNRNQQSFRYPTHTQFGYSDGGFNDFASIGLIATGASSNYNSLQLSVDKGLTHGLQLQASYTYSHSLDNASSFENAGFGSNGQRGFNQFFTNLNYGNSLFDARNRFVIAPVYVVPYTKRGSAYSPANLLLSGWEISGIATFASGFPFDISYAGGTSLSLWCSASFSYYACPDAPNQVGPIQRADPRKFIPTSSGGSTNRTAWFVNPAASPSFTPEVLGTFGNMARNKYHGPGINNTNLILAKNFAFSSDGTRYLQLRMESDNVFNHTQFLNPTSTFTSANLGQISSAAAARQTQLGVKVYF
jgi:hypothetical protein